MRHDWLARSATINALTEAADRAGLPLDGVYVVGGAVRDGLLDRPILDLDLAVEGDGVDFAERLAEAMGGRVVARHGFGTAAIVAPPGDMRIDVATARAERYPHPGSLPEVEPAESIERDLQRRDFTINAIAVALAGTRRGEPIDPLGGMPDLEDGVVRVLHDASFRDDPTRILRGIRYAARYGFAIEPHTRDLISSALADGVLATVSVDRVRAELELLLEEPAAAAVALLVDLDVAANLPASLPIGAAQVDLVRRIDEAEGTDATTQLLAWRMRLAALVAPLGPDGARRWLRACNVRARDIHAVTDHVRALALVDREHARIADASRAELAALLRGLSPQSLDLAALAASDAAVRHAIAAHAAALDEVRLAVTGHDLLALGIPRGPLVGEVLEQLYDMKLAGEIASEEEERTAAARLVAGL